MRARSAGMGCSRVSVGARSRGAPDHDPALLVPVLAVIPARSGSKGIPGKNVRSFLGRPLVEWTVECGKRSSRIDRVLVSTDAPLTAEICSHAGAEVPFLRPAALSGDLTPTAAVVRHALDWLTEAENWTPGVVVVLEPTSPGRQPRHIDEAIDLLIESSADSVASIAPVPHHFAPGKILRRGLDGTVTGWDGTHPRDMVHRRQDVELAFAFDGAVFACRTSVLSTAPPTLWGPRVAGYVMEERYCVDLDTEHDWAAAEARLWPVLIQGGML